MLIEPLFRRMFEISEETYGAKHIDFADGLNNLAELCLNQDEYNETHSKE